jgi:hypothetical protein
LLRFAGRCRTLPDPRPAGVPGKKGADKPAQGVAMSKITILGGDLPRSSEFYNNPGSIANLAVAEVALADPEAVKKLGVAKPFSLGLKVYFLATFDDGRRALAATDPRTFKLLERDIAEGPVSPEDIEDRKKENTRMGILFIAAYFIGLFASARYLAGYLPFLAAFAVGIAACLGWMLLFSRTRKK